MKNLFFTLALLLLSAPALASMDHMDHSTHDMMPMPVMDHSEMHPSDEAYKHVNHTMHEGMMIDFTGDPDVDFLKGMIPHHQGAVEMAKVQLEYGRDGLLKSFTQRVIRDQEREIKYMKNHLSALEKANQIQSNGRSTVAFKRVNRSMHHDMNIEFTGDADADFISGMIPHHQGAVDMAKVVLAYGDDAFARRLAYGIINAQESEITWMKRWQSRQRLMQIY